MITVHVHMVPSIFLKARHHGGSAFCNFRLTGVPEQALGGIPVGFGIEIMFGSLMF